MSDRSDKPDETERRGRRRVRDEAPHPLPAAGKTARALVVSPYLTKSDDNALRTPAARLDEACGLAAAIDLDVLSALVVPLRELKPATLLGSGKVEEIGALVAAGHAELVVVDHALSPVQQRNLEKAWGAKVIDRTGLILEIFGKRARTKEGALQVELAHLDYQKSRLVRSWTHLERQRGSGGSGGFLGGPGESQLELDKRLLQDRIDGIKEELQQVVRTRELHRAGRARVPYPVVALVGYTNAGKSTLFNTVTGAEVLAKDLLFATLDPTMREVRLQSGRRIILSDTVGFISELPTSLIAAFRATLEEVVGADLILHVRDISHAETEAQRLDVERVLGELDIATEGPEAHVFEVWNKIDLLAPEIAAELPVAAQRKKPAAIPVSAVSGAGLGDLLARIDATLAVADDVLTVALAPELGGLVHWLYENGEVLDVKPAPEAAGEAAAHDEGGTGESRSSAGPLHYTVRLDAQSRGRLAARLAEAGPDRARFVR